MKILIADDDPVWRHMIQAVLVEFGEEVTAVSDGGQAWEVLGKEERPSLAILDWLMPGIDGIDICRRVRAAPDGPYIYVLLLTVKDRTTDLAEAFEAGVDDYISKPFDPSELRGRLQAARRVMSLQAALLEAQRELHIKATHDSLTGLLNRGAALDLLQRELCRGRREARPTSVVLLDVDHFKRVNDTYGHGAGDAALREVAARAQGALRAYDGVGRWGGEEFLLVLPGCDTSAALAIGERTRQAIGSEPFAVGPDEPLAITVSMGVASTSQLPDPPAEVLLRAADAALYRAKADGRDRVRLATAQELAEVAPPGPESPSGEGVRSWRV